MEKWMEAIATPLTSSVTLTATLMVPKHLRSDSGHLGQRTTQ
jgi:hypothetical protein